MAYGMWAWPSDRGGTNIDSLLMESGETIPSLNRE